MEPAAGPDHLSSCPNKLAAGARSGPVFTTAAVSGGGGEGGGGGTFISWKQIKSVQRKQALVFNLRAQKQRKGVIIE